jgi:hypothetical protein
MINATIWVANYVSAVVVEFGVIKEPPQQNVGVEDVAHSHCCSSSVVGG